MFLVLLHWELMCGWKFSITQYDQNWLTNWRNEWIIIVNQSIIHTFYFSVLLLFVQMSFLSLLNTLPPPTVTHHKICEMLSFYKNLFHTLWKITMQNNQWGDIIGLEDWECHYYLYCDCCCYCYSCFTSSIGEAIFEKHEVIESTQFLHTSNECNKLHHCSR